MLPRGGARGGAAGGGRARRGAAVPRHAGALLRAPPAGRRAAHRAPRRRRAVSTTYTFIDAAPEGPDDAHRAADVRSVPHRLITQLYSQFNYAWDKM